MIIKMAKRKKKSGWHTTVYAGKKTKVHYKKGKVTARVPVKTSGQGFTKSTKKRRKK